MDWCLVFIRKQGRLMQMWGRYQTYLQCFRYSMIFSYTPITFCHLFCPPLLFFLLYPCFLPYFFTFWKFILKTRFIKWLPVMWIWITMFVWISNMSTYQLHIFAYLLFWWLENADIYIIIRDCAGLSDIYICNLQLSLACSQTSAYHLPPRHWKHQDGQPTPYFLVGPVDSLDQDLCLVLSCFPQCWHYWC